MIKKIKNVKLAKDYNDGYCRYPAGYELFKVDAVKWGTGESYNPKIWETKLILENKTGLFEIEYDSDL